MVEFVATRGRQARVTVVYLVVLVILSLVCAAPSFGQDYPNKLVRFIVPYSAGSPPDLVTRIVATELGKILGQATIVENRPGADTIIGYEYVARQAPADGYTIAIAPVSNLALLPIVSKELRFDPIKELPPFVSLVEGKLVFGVPAATPWKTFKEVVDAVKASPGKWNYGSPSVLLRFPMLVLIQDLGLDLLHVPYASVAPYYRAIIANDVQMGFSAEASAIGTLGDKFRVLGITGDRRSAAYPNAPTFASLGYPQLPGNIFAFSARAGTPKAVIDKLHAATMQVLRQPEVKARFAGMQFEPMDESSQAAEQRLADQAKLFADVARTVGIKPQ